MPDRPFETVPPLPWQGKHVADRCDQCGGRTHHLFFLEGLRKWVCALCKHGANVMQVEAEVEA